MPKREGVGENPIDGGGSAAAVSEPSGPAVSGELLWKARAQDAEAKAGALEERRELSGSWTRRGGAGAAAERRNEIDREAGRAGRSTRRRWRCWRSWALGQMDEPDAAGDREVEEPRSRSCSRAHGRDGDGGGAHGDEPRRSNRRGRGAVLGDLAERARASGDRRAAAGVSAGLRGVSVRA
ncbi:MAG: hypothetical protein R3B49_01200 [Phycisphaerales bacterium]